MRSDKLKLKTKYVELLSSFIHEDSLLFPNRKGWEEYEFKLFANGYLAYFHPEFVRSR